MDGGDRVLVAHAALDVQAGGAHRGERRVQPQPGGLAPGAPARGGAGTSRVNEQCARAARSLSAAISSAESAVTLATTRILNCQVIALLVRSEPIA